MDWTESAAVRVRSITGQGNLSGQQVGHTGSESATFVSSNPVPLGDTLDPANYPVASSVGHPIAPSQCDGRSGSNVWYPKVPSLTGQPQGFPGVGPDGLSGGWPPILKVNWQSRLLEKMRSVDMMTPSMFELNKLQLVCC